MVCGLRRPVVVVDRPVYRADVNP
eukprot:COSAG06_NODE_73004_length_163_cov_1498.953125_1_plen_23_part_10